MLGPANTRQGPPGAGDLLASASRRRGAATARGWGLTWVAGWAARRGSGCRTPGCRRREGSRREGAPHPSCPAPASAPRSAGQEDGVRASRGNAPGQAGPPGRAAKRGQDRLNRRGWGQPPSISPPAPGGLEALPSRDEAPHFGWVGELVPGCAQP